MPNPPRVPAIDQTQLVALCEEMAALVRAGVPLDKGLVALGGDVPGRLGKFAAALGQRLEQGESLDAVFDDPQLSIPPAFRAVVAAGIRSGRLSAALEEMAGTLRRAIELRRLAAVSLIYPLLLLAMAYLLFAFTADRWAATVLPAYRRMLLHGNWPLELIGYLGSREAAWLVWPPLALLLLLAGYRLLARRPRWSSRGRRIGRWPTPGRLLQLGRVATFADVLSLLVRQQVPLAEALELAGDASGDRRMASDARQFADRLRRGETPESLVAAAGAIPPLLAWRLASLLRQGALADSLSRAADAYRRQARRTYDSLTVSIPLVLTVAIGGTATAVYGLSVFVPWITIIMQLQSQG